jgi:hypothetical protein
MQRVATTPDNNSNRDTLTETSSQKSAKIIRTNGLVKAEKPNISKSRIINNQVSNKLSNSQIKSNIEANNIR